MTSEPDSLIKRIDEGDAAAVARAISKIEDGSEDASALMKQIYKASRGGVVIGITGAPGAGKSSLVDKLAQHYREQGERVGIIAVDPSSPFSGGAILGDRIRMQTLGLMRVSSSVQWRLAGTWVDLPGRPWMPLRFWTRLVIPRSLLKQSVLVRTKWR